MFSLEKGGVCVCDKPHALLCALPEVKFGGKSLGLALGERDARQVQKHKAPLSDAFPRRACGHLRMSVEWSRWAFLVAVVK